MIETDECKELVESINRLAQSMIDRVDRIKTESGEWDKHFLLYMSDISQLRTLVNAVYNLAQI
jgi:hypothetical protein